MKIRFILIALLVLTGCETVTDAVDSWFTQGPAGEDSQAERIVETGGWLVPSPYRELVAVVVGGFAGFWTQSRRQKKSA